MKTYLIPIIDAKGLQFLKKVTGTSIGDVLAKVGLAITGSGQQIGAPPTEVIDENGVIVQWGLDSVKTNFSALPGVANLHDVNSVNNIASLVSGADDFGNISADTGSATEEFSFRPAFEQGLRQSGIDVRGGGGVRGALANRAFDPLLSRATLSAAFNPLGGDYDPEATQKSLMEGLTFQNYLKGQAAANSLYGTGGAQAARGLFEQARNLSGDPLAALKAMGEGGGISGQFLKPATIAQGATLANVAREAGRQRFGSFARFLPSAQDLTQTYLSYAPETQGPQQQSFADFLNQRIFG